MKSIIFKIWKYPLLSETFITSQIITAINCGFDVKILIGELLSFQESKQVELLEKYCILDKIIIENYKIPENKMLRLLKWFFLLFLNVSFLPKIIFFYKYQESFSLTWLYQLVFYKKYRNVSVFHVQYGTNKAPLDVLKKINFIKSSLIVSFHGHDAFFPINGFIPNNGYYDNLFSSANTIVANTPYLAETLKELGCRSEILKTIPVGVDTTFFYPPANKKIKSKQFKLITVGRLSPVKGHIYAFESLKRLKLLGYNVTLTVIGQGDEYKNLENFILENNLKDKILLVGSKSQTEVRDLLYNSDLFIFTSVSLPNSRRETMGLATLEAQACGLPAVVFDSGGVKYTVKNKETGFVVPEFDTSVMAIRIAELIENVELRKEMSSKAVRFVSENYSQKVIEKKWKTLYE